MLILSNTLINVLKLHSFYFQIFTKPIYNTKFLEFINSELKQLSCLLWEEVLKQNGKKPAACFRGLGCCALRLAAGARSLGENECMGHMKAGTQAG